MRLFTVGTFTHDWDRLNIDAWPGGRQRDAIAELVRESDAIKTAAKELAATGKYTADGIVEKLASRVRDRTLPAIAKAREASAAAAVELKAVKSGLHERIFAKTTPREDALRAEQRAFLRSQPSAERKQLAFEPVYARAILEQPAEMSGLQAEIFEMVENTFLRAEFPGALEAAETIVLSGNIVAQAASGLENYLRAEKLVTVSIKGEMTAAIA